MFENLNTLNEKKFKKDVINELVVFLRKLRNEDEEIMSTPIWGQLQTLKGELVAGSSSISEIITKMDNLVVTQNGPLYDQIRSCCRDFVKMKDNPNYKQFITHATVDSKQSPVRTPSVLSTPSTLFPQKQNDTSNTTAASPTINERILQQINSIDKKEVDKSEAVRVLMSIAMPGMYNGYFIDIDKDVAGKIDRTMSSGVKEIKDRLAEIEKRIDKLLAMEVDKLIEKAISEGKNRVQIIFKTGGHYTPVDIDIKNKSCLIVDAAQDFRRSRLFSLPEYSKYIDKEKIIDARSSGFEFEGKTINGGALQKTEHGCWIFSLYHSFEMAKMPSIHQNVIDSSKAQSNDKVRTVDWVDLPPTIVCLAQSTTFLEYYKAKHQDHKSKEISELTNNNERSFGYNTTILSFKKQLQNISTSKNESEINEIIGMQSLSHALKY